MTLRVYPTGYGLREPVPECQPIDQVDCPCCEGAGEHSYGQGMDADAVTCRVCDGYGYLITSLPTKGGTNGKTT